MNNELTAENNWFQLPKQKKKGEVSLQKPVQSLYDSDRAPTQKHTGAILVKNNLRLCFTESTL